MRRVAFSVFVVSIVAGAMVFAAGAPGKESRAQEGKVTLEAAQGIGVLDPYKKLFQYSVTLYPLLWNALTAYSENKGAVPQPQLATGWKTSAGGKVYTFAIRPGVQFS